MKTKKNSARLSFIFSMCIFGTIGIFVRFIPLPSSVIALSRGITGTLFLLIFVKLKKIALSPETVKRRLAPLCITGGLIGANWILLFESYRYTSIATATLCYYMAPIFIILASPLVLREKLTWKKLLCVLAALFGMFFVSGAAESGPLPSGALKGIALGIGAAAFYACVILLNKKLSDVPAYDRTIVQLASSSAVILPYVLLTENIARLHASPGALLLLLCVGIIHTGLAYAIYFGSMTTLKAQTAALLSYVDPVVALILSALVLNERISLQNILGAALILGSTLISELTDK